MGAPLCDLPVPGEAAGTSCVAPKAAGFGVCAIPSELLGLGQGLVIRSETAPGIKVCLPAQAGSDSGAVGSF